MTMTKMTILNKHNTDDDDNDDDDDDDDDEEPRVLSLTGISTHRTYFLRREGLWCARRVPVQEL